MKTNRYREAIAAGRIPVGHMVWEFSTRGIAKILDSVDLDFVLFDMEHSCIEIERMADLMAWSKAGRFAPMVRVPTGQYHFLARVMDAGALGVMIPNVETPEHAKALVNAVKFAPMGHRGVGLGSAHTDYVAPNPHEYFREINESSVVICQIESPTGVANVEAIAATPGVDIVWVGHYDLSQSMGIPGEFDDPRFIDAINRVVAAARTHGKRAGIQPGNVKQAEAWIAAGFNVISWGADSAVYRSALLESVNWVRAAAHRDAQSR
jgi:2-keto-3-deoxy-L-rhamnonate aldolase RhmA